MSSRLHVVVVGALLFGAPAAISAQGIPGPGLSVMGGLFSYDVEEHGDGTASFVAARFQLPLGERLVVEPSVGRASYSAETVEEGADDDVSLVLLDFQLQYHLPLGGIRPYLGVGAGGALDMRDERGGSDFVVSTYTASAGARYTLTPGLGLVGEIRFRGLDETRNSAIEVGAGLSIQF